MVRRPILETHSLPYRPRKSAEEDGDQTSSSPAQRNSNAIKLWTDDRYTHLVMNDHFRILRSQRLPCKEKDVIWLLRTFMCWDHSIDPEQDPVMWKMWEHDLGDKQLPALMLRGCIVADFKQLKRWMEAGELMKHVDEICERAELYLPDPPPPPKDATFDDLEYIPGYGINETFAPVPPWANLPPPIPVFELHKIGAISYEHHFNGRKLIETTYLTLYEGNERQE